MAAGSKPGERRGGRQKGTPNKSTRELKAALQKHQDELIKALLDLTRSEDERVRLGAIQACLDRGWGKAAQPLTGEDGEGPAIVRIERVIVDPAYPDN